MRKDAFDWNVGFHMESVSCLHNIKMCPRILCHKPGFSSGALLFASNLPDNELNSRMASMEDLAERKYLQITHDSLYSAATKA